MTLRVRHCCALLLLAATGFAQSPQGAPAPFAAPRPSAPSAILVNIIPAGAEYAMFLTLKPQHPTMRPEDGPGTGQNLGLEFPELRQIAAQHGANLVVFLGAEHGITVPLPGIRTPLLLRWDNPAITAILFRWPGAPSPTLHEKAIRFTTGPVPAEKDLPGDSGVKQITYAIGLKSVPPNTDLGAWVYTNLPRFVADSIRHDFDTVAMRSTDDPSFVNVWLPGCDAPLRVSKATPLISVTIFKRPTDTVAR